MTRSYAADDPEIGDIMRRQQAERMAVIAGCTCGPPEPGKSIEAHKPSCPFGPGLPPATPPVSGVIAVGEAGPDVAWFVDTYAAILADHRRAVADWADETLRRQGR